MCTATTMILIVVPVAEAEAEDRRTGLTASQVGAMSSAASIVAPRPMLMEIVPS